MPLTTFKFRDRGGYVQPSHIRQQQSCNSGIKSGKGFVLVEAVVAAAICAVVLAGAVGAFILTVHGAMGNTPQVQSAFLASEGLEAVRLLRDSSWSANIATQTSGTPFYLSYATTTNAWTATSTDTFIDHTFERAVVFADVYRDANENIVTGGGTLDSNTKKVTVTVSWNNGNATSSRSLSTYLANIFNN